MIPTTEPRAPLRVLGISGSVRRASYNRALLEAARELAPGEMTITVHDLSPLPLFRPETEPPAEVRELIAAIAAADALLVATPEYNYGVPAVLCSAFEWASQPPCSSVLRGKPAAVMGASTGRGGTVRAQLQLRQTFLYAGVCALLQPELMVDRAQDHFSADGRLVTPALRDRLSSLLVGLAEWTRRLGGPVPVPRAALAAQPAQAAVPAANGNGGSPSLHGAGEVVLQEG
ncbi:MAG TPA: NAD(P)H-dependent oxidoreductase [Longimicrobium sp.]|nr:NAD(P)H-dependent oxidoreductase [Longimicrobium sp.]